MNADSLHDEALASVIRTIIILSQFIVGSIAQGQTGDVSREIDGEEDEVSFSVGAIYSNNIDRSPEDGLDELVGSVGTTVNLASDERRSSYRINIDGDYRKYTKDTYENEFLGGLSGEYLFWLAEDRFQWVLSDDFGQAQYDIGQVSTPENRYDFNVFSTGPRFLLPIGGRNFFALNAQYRDVYLEGRNDDYWEYVGGVGFLRSLSRTRDIGVFANASRIEYKDDAFEPADINSVFLLLNSIGARSELSVRLGSNYFENSEGRESGALADFEFSRELSRRIAIELSGFYGFVGTADAVLDIRDQDGSSIDQEVRIVDFSQPSRQQSVGLAVDWQGESTNLRFSSAFVREQGLFSESDIDRARIVYRAEYSRRFGEWSTLYASASYDDDEIDDDLDPFVRLTYGIGLQFGLNDRFLIQCSINKYEGDGGLTRPDFLYDEIEAGLSLIYRPLRENVSVAN